MERKLEGKIIDITGATKGIGRGCAKVCLPHGARITVTARDARAAAAGLAAEGFGADAVLYLDCDVRQAGDIAETIRRTVDHYGRLDGLINNAGWHPPAQTIEETSLDDFDILMRLNLTSSFLGGKFAVPHLRPTRGAIVNMSSKAAQVGLTKALALDLAKDGERVNAVCPAAVRTPLVEEWAASLADIPRLP